MCPNSTYWMADLLIYDPKSLKRKKPSNTGYCFCGVGRNTWGQENAEEKQAQNKPRLTKYANTDLIKGEFSAKNREFSTGFFKNPEFRGFLSKITGFKGLKCALIAPFGWRISGLTGRITPFWKKPFHQRVHRAPHLLGSPCGYCRHDLLPVQGNRPVMDYHSR